MARCCDVPNVRESVRRRNRFSGFETPPDAQIPEDSSVRAVGFLESQQGSAEVEAAPHGVDCGRFAVFTEEDVAPKRQTFFGGSQDDTALPVSASIAGGAQVVSIADDSDDQSSHHTSDTESVDQNPGISRRRLRLMWDPDLDARRQVWHPKARAVECLFRELVSRIGAAPGAPIPRPLRQQRWSPVNVPLMWGAACSSGLAPAAFDHLMSMASRIRDPVDFHDNRLSAVDALRAGWVLLRAVFRSWGIQDREHLTAHLRRQGFPATQPGNHISARAQEVLLAEACQVDGRVALLEVVCTNVAIHLGREWAVPEAIRPQSTPDATGHSCTGVQLASTRPIQFGGLPLDKGSHIAEVPSFLARKVAPDLLIHVGRAVSRQNGKRCGREVRAWKFLGLIPATLLHRPKGVGSVGRAGFPTGSLGAVVAQGTGCFSKVVTTSTTSATEERNIVEGAGLPKSGCNRGKSHVHDRS